ncbi:hypothetical protein HU200_034877 [Digitaria exilis]|uniref:DUF4057 domain-containing protein n=1 Tax=Digitaria exilis TaxID=1010633 RepID=A0A835EN97_9POAL|nr:hypothetical protein HU200_034877 [Digitaria exilis]
MERASPVRSSHTSTAGLLAWPHPDGAGPLPARRPNQPTEEFRKVVFGGQGAEEADARKNMRCCSFDRSRKKWKEISGSSILKAEASAAAPTASRDRQASQITFAQDGSIAPRKPTSVAEVARQRELSHTVQSEADSKTKRQVSTAKSKELSGHDIFADHEDPKPNRSRRSDYSSSTSLSPVKNANVSTFSFGEADTDSAAKTARKKGTGNKTTDLGGKALLQREPAAPVVKKPLNRAKLEETTGSSVVFADGKAPATGEQAGRRTRQPPGGDSRISLG